MSKAQTKRYEAVIESLGAVRLDKPHKGRGYTHVFTSRIGPLYLRVDTDGPVLTLFGNFLDNIKEAKNEFGHWKYNLHEVKKGNDNFDLSIKWHLDRVL